MSKALIEAIANLDMDAVERELAAGADLNALGQYGEPPMIKAMGDYYATRHPETKDDEECRAFAVAFFSDLIRLGADPHWLDDEGGGILISPIFAQDEAMMTMLLEHGVDPNLGLRYPTETVYDFAEFDYRFETNLPFGDPTPEDRVNPDAWLRFLDCEAIAYGKPRPDFLFALRRHGALTTRELRHRMDLPADQIIEWRDGAWRLYEPRST